MEAQRLGASHGFFFGDGEMATAIRNFDWGNHPLGPPDAWPASLKTTVQIALSTQHPVFIYWGPKHFCLYNDAFRASLGPEKHPTMLGKEAADFWPEAWSQLSAQTDQIMAGGPATWHENQLVPILRGGRLEDVYWTYSWGPIFEESAPHGVGGILVICNETRHGSPDAFAPGCRRLHHRSERPSSSVTGNCGSACRITPPCNLSHGWRGAVGGTHAQPLSSRLKTVF